MNGQSRQGGFRGLISRVQGRLGGGNQAAPGPGPGRGGPTANRQQIPAPPPRPIHPGIAKIQHQGARQEAGRLQRYFNDTRRKWFEFEDVVGQGQYGVACRVKLLPTSKWSSRQFVVKRALSQDARNSITSEEKILRTLRGAMHIMQLFKTFPSVPDPITDLQPGFTIMTEWLSNGRLVDFARRRREWGYPLPNRLLYDLFLCLLKACMAMAWPPNGPTNAPVRTETLQTRPKTQLRHNDMHFRNLLFGDRDADEHSTLPILKTIDFGLADYAPDPMKIDAGVRKNIQDIGLVMQAIITGFENYSPVARDVSLRILGTRRDFKSYGWALTSTSKYPNLDPDLMKLIVWCLAEGTMSRPTFEQLHHAITADISRKDSQHYINYPGGHRETIARMEALVQQLVYNAPPAMVFGAP